MARGNPGKIVKYTTLKGETMLAIAYDKEQTSAFSKYGKVVLHLINEDYTLKKDENGKKLISLKHQSELTIIGFVD